MHRILKSDLKLSKALPRLLSVDDCEQNPTSYNCENLSDVIYNLNDVRRWLRPTVGKISAQTLLFDILPSKFAR